ncbi:MAG: LamG domain-containing protein [Planctomycetota bacterium]
MRAMFSATAAWLLGLTATVQGQELQSYDGFAGSLAPGAQASAHGANRGFGFTGPWRGADDAFPSLVSWWPLESNPFDLGPRAAHGVNTGAQYTTETPNPSWSAGSLSLGGSGNVDLSAHASTFGTLSRGTLSAWVRTEVNGARQTIFSVSDASGTGTRFAELFVHSDGRAGWEVQGDLATNPRFVAQRTVNDGEWHHVAVVTTGDGWSRLYVDGAERSSDDEGFLGYVTNPDSMFIGVRRTTASMVTPFTGDIDDVAIWADALSAEDIASLATMPPISVVGPQTPTGPALVSESLATASRPNGAFGSRGLSPQGTRLFDDMGNRAVRHLANFIDHDSTNVHYLSFLLRRDDRGGMITPGDISISGPDQFGARMGWDSVGDWVGNIRANPAKANGQMLDATTYFCVVKITTDQGNGDRLQMRAYAPGETVPATEDEVAQWTINRGQQSAKAGDAIMVTLNRGQYGGDSVLEFDELRMGRSWDSVTRQTFGQGCANLTLARRGAPVLGGSVGVDLVGAPAGALIAGGDRSMAFGLTLPADLTTAGAPGCWLLQSAQLALPAAGGLDLAVPNAPALVGRALFAQWIAPDPTGSLPLGVALSDGLELIVER